jgi:hypothetical protein
MNEAGLLQRNSAFNTSPIKKYAGKGKNCIQSEISLLTGSYGNAPKEHF